MANQSILLHALSLPDLAAAAKVLESASTNTTLLTSSKHCIRLINSSCRAARWVCILVHLKIWHLSSIRSNSLNSSSSHQIRTKVDRLTSRANLEPSVKRYCRVSHAISDTTFCLMPNQIINLKITVEFAMIGKTDSAPGTNAGTYT